MQAISPKTFHWIFSRENHCFNRKVRQWENFYRMAILGLLNRGVQQVTGKITCPCKTCVLSLPGDIDLWPSVRGTHIGFTQQDVYGAFDPVIRMGSK
jgi:hypothetical protein